MKYKLLLALAVLLVAVIAISGPSLVAGNTTDPSPTPATDSPALTEVLDELRDGVQPGTAGSSLKAAVVAADLLDWAEVLIPQQTLDTTVQKWLAAQSRETLALLPEQLESLQHTIDQLVTDYEGSAGLLTDAGLEGRGPWNEAAMDQVNALFKALNKVIE